MKTAKLLCPTCRARAIALMAWSGSLPPLHGQPNIITNFRCEMGHSFQTVAYFDGTQYQEHSTHFVESVSTITVCWD